ncbi:hypothetical protein BH10ACT8_BH10ACT8_07860 [soil metagenome]
MIKIPDIAKRFIACIAGSLVLALMIGKQEGTQDDYGLAFRQAILSPRVVVFLLIGVGFFAALTYWASIKPYLLKTGMRPLLIGGLTVVIAQLLLKWLDPLGDGKLATVAGQAGNTDGLSPTAKLFFSYHLYWFWLLLTLALAGTAIVLSIRALAWVAAIAAVIGAVWAYTAHASVVSFVAAVDHSMGANVTLIGYLTIAAAAATMALAKDDVADTRAFIDRALAWRPGMPLVVLGILAGIIAFGQATWFSPQARNYTLLDTKDYFAGNGLANLAYQYLAWLGWVLFAVTALLVALASFRRIRLIGWIGAALGVLSVVLTLITLYDTSSLAASAGVDSASGPWQNLGSGGWLACIAFSFLAGAGVIVAADVRLPARANRAVSSDRSPARRAGLLGGSQTTKTLLFAGIALALFYPPTATEYWQKVIVSEIGVYVLLAVGLNVVVGWAGLLDLGFIAFYAIGSYVTAYLVGSLPHKPPHWLHMSPLLAIPFAIVACLLAGLALGAPTLRLRGDYLAIVTLGFGEIIRNIAIINPGNITNSTRGPSPAVPHPVIHLGPLNWQWGLNSLQYWYLLLFLIVVVAALFYRLEGSRLGRAWAAIREDEVAAQATGINTTRVKLLAFAIGASTSGLAGVFFATQVGYFNPDNFVLNTSILVVAYVVFGGMGSLPGAMAGAAVLTWLPEFLRDQVPAEDRTMWIGAVVLLMMIFRPAGLIPARRRKAELSGFGSPASAETVAVPVSEGL